MVIKTIKTTTTVKEYDLEGRLTKETITETLSEIPVSSDTHIYPWVAPVTPNIIPNPCIVPNPWIIKPYTSATTIPNNIYKKEGASENKPVSIMLVSQEDLIKFWEHSND